MTERIRVTPFKRFNLKGMQPSIQESPEIEDDAQKKKMELMQRIRNAKKDDDGEVSQEDEAVEEEEEVGDSGKEREGSEDGFDQVVPSARSSEKVFESAKEPEEKPAEKKSVAAKSAPVSEKAVDDEETEEDLLTEDDVKPIKSKFSAIQILTGKKIWLNRIDLVVTTTLNIISFLLLIVFAGGSMSYAVLMSFAYSNFYFFLSLLVPLIMSVVNSYYSGISLWRGMRTGKIVMIANLLISIAISFLVLGFCLGVLFSVPMMWLRCATSK